MPADETALLRLTDSIIGLPKPPDAATIAELRKHWSEEELTEIIMGIGLFLAMSKTLIVLGTEPEEMPLTVLPAPGSV